MFKAGKGGSLASKIAHTSLIPLGNQDLRALQELINSEKTVLSSLQRLSADYSKAADSLKAFGAAEGDDLNDVLGHSARIMGHVCAALNQLANHEHAVRGHMKAIRTREENLHDLRTRRKAVGVKAEAAEKKLSKMSGEHKGLTQQTDLLNQLRDQMRSLDIEILTEEAGVGDFKRSASKHFLTLKFGGLLEFAEKATIVGEIGKVLIDEIPLEPTHPGYQRPMYQGFEKTHKLVQEVDRCVAEVAFTPSADGLHLPPNIAMGRASEDSAGPAMFPSSVTHDRFSTVNSQRTDHSEYAPSPTAQDISRPSEFGEEPPAAPAQLLEDPARAATFPSSQSRRTDRNVSFTQSIQDALTSSRNLSNIDVSSGPPLSIPSPPQSPRSPTRDESTQPNPWDAPLPSPERPLSWSNLPEDERAKNQAAARDIGLTIFAPAEPAHLQRTTSVPPPPPVMAAMPALRTPSPSMMPQPLPPSTYAPPGQPPQSAGYAPPPQAGGYAPPPAPPSMYGTPAQSYTGEHPTTPGGGRITAAAFKRAPAGLRSPSGSLTDIRRGTLPTSPRAEEQQLGMGLGPAPTRQGTLPPYEPRVYAEDAFSSGSPTDTDYGALGPTRIHNSDAGYAQGRFATNLEHH